MQTLISIIYTVCGLIYTILAGKGRVLCYSFGIIATSCYSYISYSNHVYGNLLLNIGYYLPMQIIGIFEWNRHLKSGKNEIIKTKLTNKNRVILGIMTICLTFAVWFVLNRLDENTPLLDSITTVFSVLGMYLTVKRCIEQWLVWIVVNTTAIIMWLKLSFANRETYSTVVVWSVYLILGIYFYFQWKNELKTETNA